MKKLMVVAVVMALAIPAIAWSAATPGKYAGVATYSAAQELNGSKNLNADVKAEGTKTIAIVNLAGSKEEWTWDDKTLVQKEFDATGKVTQQYTATASAPGTYNVNCTDKAKNVCDAGIDSRNYWTIKTTPESFTYLVYGVGKDKKADPTAKAEKRHEFTFNLAK